MVHLHNRLHPSNSIKKISSGSFNSELHPPILVVQPQGSNPLLSQAPVLMIDLMSISIIIEQKQKKTIHMVHPIFLFRITSMCIRG